MQIQQRILLVRAFRKLQEGVLTGLELVDACGEGEIDSPEDLGELIVHLGKLEEHAQVMQEALAQYAGANALLDTVTRTRMAVVHVGNDPKGIGRS